MRTGAPRQVEDLNDVAVVKGVRSPDSLAVEPRRWPPPAPGALVADLVVDRVGDVLDRHRRVERDRIFLGLAVMTEVDPDEACQSPDRITEGVEALVVEDRDREHVSPGQAAAIRSTAPGSASSNFVAATIAGRSMAAASSSRRSTASPRGRRSIVAEHHRVRVAQHAEERTTAAAALVRSSINRGSRRAGRARRRSA